ncbi:zymogen granule protein 16 homolog B [Otolemur garnettii]|uniref:zymogen granule protein 16 homolog B n=1 Tax=Otolemur garnettii TaxID=30611 RepID=UPI0006441D6F|nr:zymogen granule protein 16 homolog B [Otolemur garnettii]
MRSPAWLQEAWQTADPWSRPEAMLLLVTLMLLGSHLCWAHQMFGLGGGHYFSSSDYYHDISGLRIGVGSPMLKRVQVQFDTYWDNQHGASGGKTQELKLWPGEHIIKVHGSFKAFLRQLIFCTNWGRCIPFGEKGGNEFSAFPSEEGQVLIGIIGQYGLLGLKSIGFIWDYPLEEATSAQPTTVTTT